MCAFRIPFLRVHPSLRYPDKAKEAVCALNIDFKRKPCCKTAVKKREEKNKERERERERGETRIRQTSKFLFAILMENWKAPGGADTMDWYGEDPRRLSARLTSATSSFVDNGVVSTHISARNTPPRVFLSLRLADSFLQVAFLSHTLGEIFPRRRIRARYLYLYESLECQFLDKISFTLASETM